LRISFLKAGHSGLAVISDHKGVFQDGIGIRTICDPTLPAKGAERMGYPQGWVGVSSQKTGRVATCHVQSFEISFAGDLPEVVHLCQG
jgi:hypothetical protein